MPPRRPALDPADDLTAMVDVDFDAVLAPLLAQRDRSPIIRPSVESEVRALIDTSRPGAGEPLDGLIAQVARAVDAYPRRNTHPGFFGWVAPSGLPTDPLAHAMAAAINANVGGYWSSPVGTTIEKTVIRWLAELAGFPPAAEGVILSGGSISNLCGIASALVHAVGPGFRERGIAAFPADARPVVICSAAAHFSVRRAAIMLGLGGNNVVALDTDDEFRLRPESLEAALATHANVVCVVATAGTTNTGAIDPLPEIAGLCRRHGVWLHVDAALGGGGLMSPALRPRYAGIEQADSVVMDLHKWFFQSLAGSLLLYRDADPARELFYDSPEYLRAGDDARTPEQYMFFHIAPELSRRFRGLPFYLAFRAYGFERLGRNALHNVECAEYLAALIEAEDELELVVAPQLSILCFRYRPAGIDDDRVDAINESIRERIQLDGDYLMSATRIRGRPVLRVCILNHATRAEHVEGLLTSVLRIGRELN